MAPPLGSASRRRRAVCGLSRHLCVVRAAGGDRDRAPLTETGAPHGGSWARPPHARGRDPPAAPLLFAPREPRTQPLRRVCRVPRINFLGDGAGAGAEPSGAVCPGGRGQERGAAPWLCIRPPEASVLAPGGVGPLAYFWVWRGPARALIAGWKLTHHPRHLLASHSALSTEPTCHHVRVSLPKSHSNHVPALPHRMSALSSNS